MAGETGFGIDFPVEEFEGAIRSAMQMAQPEDPTLRPTFRWTTKREFTQADRAGKPFTLSQTPLSEESHPDLQVLCLVTFEGGGGDNTVYTGITDFTRAKAKIQLFDAEYQQIKDADEVLLGKNTYKIKFTQPPEALFESTIWYMHVQAVDES